MPAEKREIDTPAFLVDLDAFERNLHKMQDFLNEHGVHLRPHFKCHRVPEIATCQMEAGAIGITVAKLAEAELLVKEGIRNVLIANEIRGEQKIKRLVTLARGAEDLMVAVDDERGALEIAHAAKAFDAEVGILVDVDVGMGRCGTTPEEAVRLAKIAKGQAGLVFRGLMGYEGHVQKPPPSEEKENACRSAMKALIDAKEAIEAEGLEVGIVSAGGTRSYYITGCYPGITEIQAGSYCLMDLASKEGGGDFELASTILTTVISRPAPDRAVTDAGMKSIHPACGMPKVKDRDGIEATGLHAEHGILKLDPAVKLAPGDPLEMIVPYLDGTVNIHEKLYCLRGDAVVGTWNVSGRYCST
ncbi:MAG: DSD1 family PLP-dependent enzyme [Planctomycetes bacterium]|nr:DSD1 family PLP-dependent enzyme [Planctomycetota bacterium]